jgi:DNA gyrase subunit A
VEEIEEEDLIEEKQVVITLTHLGYIKRIDAETYKTQRRGGRGIIAAGMRDNDFIRDIIITSTHDHLLFFTNFGKVYKIKAYEIPEAQRNAKGTPAVNFLQLMQRERITAVLPIRDFEEGKYLMFMTKKGLVKKTSLDNYANIKKGGLIAIKLNDGDELIGIDETTGKNMVTSVTKMGMTISFHEDDVRAMGRVAAGVKAITLGKEDEVVSMVLGEPGEQLLVVTKNGYGKRTDIEEYRIQSRGGKGLLTYDKKKFAKTGELIGACIIGDGDEVMLINSDGIIIRIGMADVRPMGRTTQGVKIMKVGDDSQIIAMAKVPPEEDGEDADGAESEEENDTGSGN